MQSRSWRRRGGWAALFALALQIALSFGHLHPLHTASAPTLMAQAEGPLHSGGGDPRDCAQDICAICVSISLASTVTLPPPLILAAPVATYAVIEFRRSTVVQPRLPQHPFQTRAPPTA